MSWSTNPRGIRQNTELVYHKIMRYKEPGIMQQSADIPVALQFHIQNMPDTVITTEVKSVILLGRAGKPDDEQPGIEFVGFKAKQSGISRYHAMIFLRDNKILIHDVGSLNGTYLDGEQLIPGHEYPLTDGCFIKLGKFAFRVIFKYA